MEAQALSPNVLAVRRWRDGQERLLVVNFGDSATRIEGAWRVLLDSGAPTAVEATGVSVQARGATILARGAA
jgi:hypothetical protein